MLVPSMQKIADIPGIDSAALELLEVAGFRDVSSLAGAGVDSLTNELIRANGILKIAKSTPGRADVERWIRAAREVAGEADEAPVEDEVSSMPVDFESMPEVAAMLDAAPCAIPFPGRWLADSRIPVGEIVPGILLNRYTGDLEVRVDDQDPEPRVVAESATAGPVHSYIHVVEKPRMTKAAIDVSRLRSIEDFAKDASPKPRRAARDGADASATSPRDLIRAPRPETNAGKNVNSRRYIRGVLHTHPWSLRVGAVVTLTLFAVIGISVAVTPLLLLQDSDPESYDWVRPWWVVFPFLVPLIGICWLIWAYSCSCRICRQKLFVPTKSRKNSKAHHLPLAGYILPLAMHLLIFQWFRCTHCGTPVRLRK